MMQPQESNLRLFFAFWPTATERAAMAEWQLPLRELCGGRLMREDTLHTTLVVLGDVAEHRLQTLCLAAQEVSSRGFGFVLKSAHYWGHNHIVYAAPETVPPQLAQLVGDLERNLRTHHFHFEARPYKPHVTLLRNAHWGDTPLPPMQAVRWQVDDFVLVQSLHDEQGAKYEVLATFPLQEA